jgi:acetyl-CoA acetyltransferase
MAPQTRQAAIVGGNRIPFARSNTAYARASNQDMLTATLDGLVARFGLQGESVGEVVAGAVLADRGQGGVDQLLATNAAVLVPPRVAAVAPVGDLLLRRRAHRLGFHVTDST